VTHLGESARLGCAVVVVESRPGVVLFAPDLVFHYVVAHHYQPPAEFINAVVARRIVPVIDAPTTSEEALRISRTLNENDDETLAHNSKAKGGGLRGFEILSRLKSTWRKVFSSCRTKNIK
jgi:hypothetical protein